MDFEKIDVYVTELLELSAISRDGEERNVYHALHNLLTAVGTFEQMDDDERDLMAQLMKKLAYFFTPKFSLKERKRNKEKKIIPPNPLLKEKENKEKEKKNPPTVCNALEKFRKECIALTKEYDYQQVSVFCNYWTEADDNGKMRFQNVRYWNTKSRFERWIGNQYSVADTAAAMRMNKLKQKQAKETAAAADMQQQAQQRDEYNDQLEREIAERKKGAVTYEEYKKMKERQS